MSSALWWSYRFLDRFKANRGYDPSKYLPFLFHQSNVFRTEYRPYNRSYTLGDEDPAQNKYIQDYRLTLNEGYQDYLTTLDRWAQSLGLTFSAQIGYNLPLDMVCLPLSVAYENVVSRSCSLQASPKSVLQKSRP